jgi:hypothetical protein
MPFTIKPGTILIKEGTLLPETVRFESESCVSGWRLVKDLDAWGLDRKIREAGWTFFCIAGQLGATVFGIDEQKTLSRESSKSWRTWSWPNLTPWKSYEWPRRPRNVSWECAI